MPDKLHPQLIDLAAAVVKAGSLTVTVEDYDRFEDRAHVASVEIAHEGRTWPATMYEPPETDWRYEDGGEVVSHHISDVAEHLRGFGFDLTKWDGR